jgi:hypothetical protein
LTSTIATVSGVREFIAAGLARQGYDLQLSGTTRRADGRRSTSAHGAAPDLVCETATVEQLDECP